MLKLIYKLPLLLIVSISSFTSNAAPLAPKELFTKYVDAVLKITINYHGIPVSLGTGFFVSSTGTLITNKHVLNDVLDPGYTADFTFKDGTKIKDFKIAGCSDDRHIDICLVQLPVQPKVWMKLSAGKPATGESVFVIGHPRGYDWSMTNGMVSGIRSLPSTGQVDRGNNHIDEVQVSSAVSPGNSGGPIFDENGNVLAMATWIRTDVGSQNLNFGISANELATYIKNHTVFVPLTTYLDQIHAENDKQAKSLSSVLINPAMSKITKGERLGDKDFTWGILTLDKKTYLKIPFPDELGIDIKKCKFKTKENENHIKVQDTITCFVGKGSSEISLILEKGSQENLKKLNGTTSDPIPSEIISGFSKVQLEQLSKKITKVQFASLYSQPKPYKCREIHEGPTWAFLPHATTCETFVPNYENPNITLLHYAIAKDGYVLSIALKFPTYYSSFFQPMLALARAGTEIEVKK